MRKYLEACLQVEAIEKAKEVQERDWNCKWKKAEEELKGIKEKYDRLAKDNEKLLSVIASLKKPVKRKPLPPKKVHRALNLFK
jgi:hypothetical protein